MSPEEPPADHANLGSGRPGPDSERTSANIGHHQVHQDSPTHHFQKEALVNTAPAAFTINISSSIVKAKSISQLYSHK